MSEEGPPKLYANKPRKAQLKQFRGQQKSNEFSSPAAMGVHGHDAAPPPPPPKVPFVRRYKFVWPILLAVNLGVGAYLFLGTKKKDIGEEEEQDVSPVSTKDTTAPVVEMSVSTPPITNPVVKREPIPQNQQLELLKWILEEKRKIKPKDAEEKQKIDEEKALIKKLIRSKSIPSV
ncbi:hypothetical protein LR48_Vigan1082s000700 [Vigna angularis]|uniref:Uncharacterized protein n=2 Tax=Phaseolus angularis TaxID=3914 RepID=A0A0L9TI47_PHAAN|nr:uncharacterized protein LOC108323326 [Vigna angularis]KAG2379921.1 uncharacterized protein HKW66_Vig0167000 [Vigna angularis]KOM30235.1 hypothetical protein LR48_Vigan1082s000700 [Vigna angularis]BAT98403.1 hypothetical protein VIGAN_09205500 [Vigna angularis var. angularis]